MGCLFLTTVFGSCTEAKYPIDPVPVAKVDSRYLGSWKEVNNSEIFRISKADEYHYLINLDPKVKRGLKANKYSAFASSINGNTFVNIEDLKDGKVNGYAFLRILGMSKDGKKIKGTFVKDSSLEKLGNSLQVRNRIIENINNAAFYSDTAEFEKIVSK